MIWCAEIDRICKNIPRKLLFIFKKKKRNSGYFKLKKKFNFFQSGKFSNFGNILSPQTRDCLNTIEITVFITFKTIPLIYFSLFYFVLVSSLTLGNYKSTQFLRYFFLFFYFDFFLSLRFQKHQQKHPIYNLSFFVSLFVSFFSSHVSLLLRLLTWHLGCFLLFSLSM